MMIKVAKEEEPRERNGKNRGSNLSIAWFSSIREPWSQAGEGRDKKKEL